MKLFNTIGSIIAFAIAAFLIYNLYNSVKTPIDERDTIASVEAAIIKKLEVIRDLEVVYQIQKGKYATEAELIKFAKEGKLYIISKKEVQVDENTVETSIDTLGTVPVLDSMKNKYKFDEKIKSEDYAKYETILNDVNNLLVIPGTEGKYKFALETGEVTKNNIKIDVFVARDIFPINPDRGGAYDMAERKHVDTVLAKIDSNLVQLDKNIRYYNQVIDAKKLEVIPGYAKYLEDKKLYDDLNFMIQNGYVYPGFDVDSLNFPEDKMVPMVPDEETGELKQDTSPEEDLEPIIEKAKELQDELVTRQKEYSEKYGDTFKDENLKIAGYERQVEELETKREFYETKPLQVGSLTEVTTNGNWQ